MTFPAALLIGGIGGVLVVFAVLFFDKMKIDDPVGALAVHLTNGIWGTLAVGLFAVDKITGVGTGNGLFYGGGFKLLGVQLLGSLSVIAFTFAISLVFWGLVKVTLGMRVTRDEEIRGLDIDEHGMEAYAGFQIYMTEYGLAPVGGNNSEAEPAKAGR